MLSLYPHIELIGSWSDGAGLLAGLKEAQPDVLLLDIHLPDKTGDLLSPIILKQYPDIRILALTNINSALYVHNMLRIGVLGYVLKNSNPRIVIEAIESVYRKEQYVDPAMKEKLHQFTSRIKKESNLMPTLTFREKETLRLTVDGYTMQEISEKLFVGLRTVEYYRSNLFLKLDVKNMAELVKKALELGIMD